MLKAIKKHALLKLRLADDFLYSFSAKKRVLLVVDGLYGYLCQHPIILELEKRSNIKIGITAVDDYTLTSINLSNNEELKKTFHRYFIPESRSQYMKWNCVLYTHPNSFYPKRNSITIGMHHGPGFGTTGSKIHMVRKFNIFFGLSSSEEKYLSSYDPEIFTGNRLFYPVGFPKSDAIVNDPIDREERLKQFRLPDRKTILITSHWLNISILSTFQDNIFKIMAEAFPDYNIMQTGHPWMWKENKDDQKKNKYHHHHAITDKQTHGIYNALKVVGDQFENAFFIPDIVAEELIPMADILVVDHSSIISNYSLLDRPIIWFKHPEFRFSMPEMESLYRNASFPFSNLDEVVGACTEALEYPELHKEGRQQMKEVFFNNLGSSSAYAADIINEVCSR